MKRILALTFLGLVLIFSALILWPVLRVRQLSKAFSGVKENDARELVLKRMGTPWKDEECGKYVGGYPAGCIEKFVYAHPYAPYAPEYWVIYFNSTHRVISDVHLVSP
jgi:hypothetical protein